MTVFSFLRKDPRQALAKALKDYSLPHFPRATMEALRLLRDPASTAPEVAARLALDPALSVRILSTVNSAAYAPRKKIENLDHAIVMLGRSSVEQIVMSFAVRGALPASARRGFEPRRFWRTAARRAAAARLLAAALHPARAAESFTAGFLQDLAVPLLAARQEARYGPILERWHQGGEDLHVLERQAFGFDHAEVATWVCDAWGLPENLAAAIAAHHGHETLACPPAVSLVGCLGETPANDGSERLVAEAAARHGLEEARAREALAEAARRAAALEGLLA